MPTQRPDGYIYYGEGSQLVEWRIGVIFDDRAEPYGCHSNGEDNVWNRASDLIRGQPGMLALGCIFGRSGASR